MQNIHPLIVHFPIALLTASALFDILGVLTKRDDLERSAWWTLLAGTIGLAASVVTGLLAESSVSIPDIAREHFNTHQEIAFVVAGIYSVLLFWRFANKTRLPQSNKGVFISLMVAGVVLMWVGSWYGGEMVYRFGVGVAK